MSIHDANRGQITYGTLIVALFKETKADPQLCHVLACLVLELDLVDTPAPAREFITAQLNARKQHAPPA